VGATGGVRRNCKKKGAKVAGGKNRGTGVLQGKTGLRKAAKQNRGIKETNVWTKERGMAWSRLIAHEVKVKEENSREIVFKRKETSARGNT